MDPFNLSDDVFSPLDAPSPRARRRRKPGEWLPIRHLHAGWRSRILRHLLSLNEDDRYMRFGYKASDEQVRQYVDGLDFNHDEVFGIVNRRLRLIAMAHLACGPAKPGQPRVAEFGVSVVAGARGRGYGTRLFGRAMMHARNAGIQKMAIYALSENTPMLKIVRNAGATIHRDGSDSESWLTLPEPSKRSRRAEAWQDRLAHWDYWLKWHAKALARWLGLEPASRSGA